MFNKENIEAYRKLVAALDFYGAGNYLRDYKESYFFAINGDSSEMAKIITENCFNDYEKVNMIAKWIHDNIVYSISGRIEMADAILDRRYGACTEHAILLCAMLNSINIPCVRIQSLRSDHSWNMAYIDNHWVWVDSTWGQWSDNEFGLHMIYTDAEIDNRYKDSKLQNGDDISQEDHGDDSICEAHQWDEGYVILEPTCLIEGTEQYCCTKCHEIKIVTLPMKAHDYGSWETIVPADSQNEGMKQRKCEYCGNVEKRVIPAAAKKDELTEKSVATTKKISGIAKKYRLKVGQKMLLKPIIKPVDSTDKLTYKSSKPAVATVNKKGRVRAVKKGTTVITIKSGKKKIRCKIIVR